MGRLDYADVEMHYRTSDLFLFAGRVSASGDRDGFPNVIGEAMSYGLPVFSSDVSGTTEGVKEGYTGYIIDPRDAESAARTIFLKMQSLDALLAVRVQAYRWVQKEFLTSTNVTKLRLALWDN
jgi:glycosyltransferase involved in cell wall biosynthesis